MCEAAGLDYQPIVMESFGTVPEPANQILRALNRQVAENTESSVEDVAKRFWARLAIDLQRSLHRALARRAVGISFPTQELCANRVISSSLLQTK